MTAKTRLSRIREWIETTDCGVPPVMYLGQSNRVTFRCPACREVVATP
jgi:hypothetical protein